MARKTWKNPKYPINNKSVPDNEKCTACNIISRMHTSPVTYILMPVMVEEPRPQPTPTVWPNCPS